MPEILVREVLSPDVTEGSTRGSMAAHLIADMKRAVNELTLVDFGTLEQNLKTHIIPDGVDLFTLPRGDYSVISQTSWDTLNNKPPVSSKTAHLVVRDIDGDSRYGLFRMCIIMELNQVWVSTRPLSPSNNNDWIKWLDSSDITINPQGIVFQSGGVIDILLANDARLTDDRDWIATELTKLEVEDRNNERVGKLSPVRLFQAIQKYYDVTFVNDVTSNVVYKGSIPTGKSPITQDDSRLNVVTTSTDGLLSKEDKSKLDGVQPNAQKNPTNATTSKDGLISAADKTKLDGVQFGAQKNLAWGTTTTNPSAYILMSKEDKVKLDDVAVGAHKNDMSVATPLKDGMLSSADKSKIDSIETNAQVNPSVATTTTDGLMSFEDKQNLDSFSLDDNGYFNFNLSGDTLLDNTFRKKTVYTGATSFTLDDYDNYIDGWSCMILLNNPTDVINISTTGGGDYIRYGISQITKHSSIVRSKKQNEFIIIDNIS